jgi:glycosyltransferase involved in cell wall biosynthesis
MPAAPHPVFAHNFYRSAVPSGENGAVEADLRLLRSAGIAVETLFTTSDSISTGRFRDATAVMTLFGSAQADRFVRRAVRERGANLLHVHNPYPLISPSVIKAAKEVGVPVVATIYNYRLVCAKGTFFRNGEICTLCMGHRWAWPSVVHACYQRSHLKSAAIASAMTVHAGAWRMVDCFIAVSPFVGEFLERMGVAEDRIRVRPNLPSFSGSPSDSSGSGVLYAGRLEPDKGVELLLAAWDRLPVDSTRPLIIVGDGSSRDSVAGAAKRRRDIRYVGVVPQSAVGELIDQTAATCIPSIWYEGLPTIFVQALARGRPVVTTSVGSLGRAVDTAVGWVAEPAVEPLAAALQEARGADDMRGRRARALYEREYSETVGLERLRAIYDECLNGRGRSVW